MKNAQARFRVEKDTWPPNQPNTFTPLLLVHHEGQHSMDQAVEVVQLVHRNNFLKSDNIVPNIGKVTKQITDILTPLEISDEPQLIIIEGAPGIGKSVLLHEIAYRWGKQELLQTFRLSSFASMPT